MAESVKVEFPEEYTEMSEEEIECVGGSSFKLTQKEQAIANTIVSAISSLAFVGMFAGAKGGTAPKAQEQPANPSASKSLINSESHIDLDNTHRIW